MRIGYARVSTADQNPALQIDALTAAGCDRIYTDHASGARTDRPELERCLELIRQDDILVVWRLDRLGRSLRHLLTLLGELADRGVQLHSLREAIDTTTASGQLVVHMLAALAEFERGLIRERTAAGLAAARAAGHIGGRPIVLTPDVREQARRLRAAGVRVSVIAQTLGIGRSTAYAALTDQADQAA